VTLVYDNLDFMRGVQAFLDGIPAASIYAMCNGLKEGAGVDDQTFGIFETLMDARSLFLTPNSTTVYVTHCFDLENGPVVLEASPGLLGPIDDAYFRHVTTSASPVRIRARAASTCSCRRATRANCPRKATSSSSRRPTRCGS
jgi:hypothetical protein